MARVVLQIHTNLAPTGLAPTPPARQDEVLRAEIMNVLTTNSDNLEQVCARG